jgi:hypothetical protein
MLLSLSKHWLIFFQFCLIREGKLLKGAIHGVGFLTRNGKRDEVLAYHNVVHCFRSGTYD